MRIAARHIVIGPVAFVTKLVDVLKSKVSTEVKRLDTQYKIENIIFTKCLAPMRDLNF